MVCQPPFSCGRNLPPRHGTSHDALRPACAIWMPIFAAPYLRQDASTRVIAASCASSQSPAHHGVMRPIGSTFVISTTTSPEPDIANAGRCCACQSDATPSSELYWHSGGTTTRLSSVRLRNVMGVKSWLMAARDYPALSTRAIELNFSGSGLGE